MDGIAREKAYARRVRIYLVRHGDAVPEEDAGSDRDRWLSPRGREAARILGRLLREQAVAADAIVVVSHEPVISSLGAFLLGRPAFPSFRTAQCCAIEAGKPTWTARADTGQVLAYFVD